jgi:membrane-anchored glycerophosphoryl diester phosphodiesterase (GDPDase)
MNPGIGEEGVKAAGTFMEIMKSQPIVLAQVVVIFVLLGFIYLQSSIRTHDIEQIHALLVKCIGNP